MALNKQAIEREASNPNLILKHSFHILSLTLLTLLLPLSFLVLSKLTSSSPPSPSPSLPPPPHTILRFLVCALSASSLLHSLTGHCPRPRTVTAWAVVCTFQACISLGIKATTAVGIKPHIHTEIGYLLWIERAVFFLGLYDTMLHWMRVFVKPLVDDTVYGMEVEAARVDRVAIGVAFGGLWLWMVRDEVEPLVVAAGKGGMLGGWRGWEGFVVWMVSYSTVVIGMVRVVEIVFWMGSHLFLFLRCRGEANVSTVNADSSADEAILLKLDLQVQQ